MPTSFTTNLLLIEPGIAEPATRNQWGALLNTDMALIDSSITGIIHLNVAGNLDVILTSIQGQPDQSRNVTFIFTGALSANIDVLWPQGLSRNFRAVNRTTGSFTLSLAADNGSGAPAGDTFVLPQDGNYYFLASDGTKVDPYIPVGVPAAGGIITGNLTVGDGSGGRFIAINGATGTLRRLIYETAGSNRWVTGANAVAEGGANAGSDFVIQNWADNGTVISTPVTITRSTGVMSLNAIPTFPTATAADNTTNGATTAFVTTAIFNLAAFAGATYFPISGGTVTGNMTVGNGANPTVLTINGAANTNRTLLFDSGGVARWNLTVNNTTESGANAGSDLQLRNFSDAGSFLGSVLTFTRSTGVGSFSQTPTFPTAASGDNSTSGATTAFTQAAIQSILQANFRYAFTVLTPSGTNAYVRLARINLTAPAGGQIYLITANVGQSFSSTVLSALKITVDGADQNGALNVIQQTNCTVQAVISLTGSGHTVDLMWLGQNGNVTVVFGTISTMPVF